MHDALLFLLTLLVVNACTVLSTVLSKSGLVQSYTSRKFVHISLGTAQLLLWGLYSADPAARLWGNLCCALYAVVFLVYGLGLLPGTIADFLIATVCRHGDFREMLYGPLVYCCTIVALGLAFWRDYPAAVVGMMVMLTGDGMAEIIGKFIGRTPVINPWGKHKTVEGACAVFLCGALGAMAACWCIFGAPHVALALVGGAVGAVAEFVSPPNFDNLCIPLSVLPLGLFIE